jgi:hypothetical protein
LLYCSDSWTIKARYARRLTAASMKYMRGKAGCIWADYKTNAQIAKELNLTPILDKLLEIKGNWIHHVSRMPRNILPSVMKSYSPTGKRNYCIPEKRLLDLCDRNESTSGPTPCQIYDDDDVILVLFLEIMLSSFSTLTFFELYFIIPVQPIRHQTCVCRTIVCPWY